MIHFFFLVNKLGQTRVARYYSDIQANERRTLESELVRKCLARTPEMVRFSHKTERDFDQKWSEIPTSIEINRKSFTMHHLKYKSKGINLKVIYRRYASLYFIMGVDESEQNEIAFYIFIHKFVQILDKYFENVVSPQFLGFVQARLFSDLQNSSFIYTYGKFIYFWSIISLHSANWISCSTWIKCFMCLRRWFKMEKL